MKLKETTLDYIRNKAWECADTYGHLASDGHEGWKYPNFMSKGEYVLDPWQGDHDGIPKILEPEKVFGWEKMDIFYAEMMKYVYPFLKDDMFLNHPDTPEGWLYIGDDKVRYALGEPGRYNLLITGLNPSTATPWKPDPTIKRIRKVMEEGKYDGWIMINLYPKRTPNPEKLPKTINRPLADANQAVISVVKEICFIGAVYAAWGTNIEKREYLWDECQRIVDILGDLPWYSRGVTKCGHPKHPLYVPYTQRLEYFPVQDYLWSVG